MLIPTGNSSAPLMYLPDAEPSRCPKCKKEEDKKEVCRHCGYEYPEEKLSGKSIALGLSIIIFALWVFITLLCWLVTSSENSLLKILVIQYEWITSLRLW
jgi:hypothetical protein